MRSFNEVLFREICEKSRIGLRSEINFKPKEYILGIDEEQYKQYLYDKYKLEPLTIDFGSETPEPPVSNKERRESRFRGEFYEVDVYVFTIKYRFTGSSSLFRMQPSTWTLTSNDIEVSDSTKIVSVKFKVYEQNVDEFNKAKASAIRSAFTNLDNVNNDAIAWNNELKHLVSTYFVESKTKFLKENDFFAAINLPIDKGTESIFNNL